MLFTIGSRVKLKRTGDLATVSAILGDGLIEVKLDGGLGHIPVPTDGITFPEDESPKTKTDGAKYVPGKQRAPAEVEANDLGMEYAIFDPWGIQLCFDPVYKSDGSAPDRYRVYLVNDLRKSIIFTINLKMPKHSSDCNIWSNGYIFHRTCWAFIQFSSAILTEYTMTTL